MNRATENDSDAELEREFDFGRSRPSPYADRFYHADHLARIDADLIEVFPTVASVNRALRLVADFLRQQAAKAAAAGPVAEPAQKQAAGRER